MKNNNFKFFIFLAFYIFSFLNISKAENLIACLDSNGNISTTVYDGESCPVGTTTGSPFFLNNNSNTTSSGVINTASNQNTNITTQNNTQTTTNATNINYNNTQNTQAQTQQEVIINRDPTLENGAFVNLDPTEYKYCVLLTKDISYGSRDAGNGNEVSALQSYLTDRGFLEYGATGYYGRATELAVKKFQYRNEISVSGNIDNNTRSIIKELTCVKSQKISYVDKPVSPSKVTTSTIKKTTTTKSTTSSTKSSTVIPATNSTKSTSISSTSNNNSYVSVNGGQTTTKAKNTTTANSSAPTLNNNKLSSSSGNMSLSKANNLYFTFTPISSSSPTICISTNTNCSVTTNNTKIVEGVKSNLYEAINISGKWSFTIYGNSSWGQSGNKVYIYLKDTASSNILSIYTINIIN